jgi:hypothetical protein
MIGGEAPIFVATNLALLDGVSFVHLTPAS